MTLAKYEERGEHGKGMYAEDLAAEFPSPAQVKLTTASSSTSQPEQLRLQLHSYGGSFFLNLLSVLKYTATN